MSHKRRAATVPAAPSASRARPAVGHRRRGRGGNKRVWLVAAAVLVVAFLGWSVWQSGALAKPALASRTEATANLLPLANPVRPLSGSHDMAAVPQATPAPQQAPKGVPLPVLQMPSLSYDFGTIPKAPPVSHIFSVENTGTADLVLRNLVTSCGCTTAELTSSVIPPGQRADLTVTFNPSFHPTQGDTVRLVWFGTNDVTQPWIEVRIESFVK